MSETKIQAWKYTRLSEEHYETDFGRILLSERVARVLRGLDGEAAKDGRKKAIREARKDRNEIEVALVTLDHLMFKYGAARPSHPLKLI